MIRLTDVSKEYPLKKGRHVVLDGVNLEVAPGQHLGILGRNGAGKSTLVRLISGAELPTSGRVERGLSVSWPMAHSGAFQPYMTGIDNIRFICRVYDANYPKVKSFVEDFSELGTYLREPIEHYSSGMRARLAFSLSMAIEFECFLIDEIIAVGDSRFHEKCRVELFEKRADRTFIIVSHNANTIRQQCDRAVVVDSGKLVSFDNVTEAFAHYLGPGPAKSGRAPLG